MKVLAVDQARHGAWAVFDTDNKMLIDCGTWVFSNKRYTFEEAILKTEYLLEDIVRTKGIDIVFLEDIQLRQNVKTFKKLAQLQGVLINFCERNGYRYGVIQPTKWQNFCNARGRTQKEIKDNVERLEVDTTKKKSKVLSMQAVKSIYGIDIKNDNLADAIMIGYFVVNNLDNVEITTPRDVT